MDHPHVDPQRLKQVAALAEKKLDEVLDALSKVLFLLTPNERQHALKPPDGFVISAGMALANAVIANPQIAAGTGHDPRQIIADLQNVATLEPLVAKLNALQQLLSDMRLFSLHDAYEPALELYGVAKVLAQKNAQLQAVVDPLGGVFASRKKPQKKEKKAPDAKT